MPHGIILEISGDYALFSRPDESLPPRLRHPDRKNAPSSPHYVLDRDHHRLAQRTFKVHDFSPANDQDSTSNVIFTPTTHLPWQLSAWNKNSTHPRNSFIRNSTAALPNILLAP